MRRTRDFEVLQLAVDPARAAELVDPQWLTTARFQPIFREKIGGGMLDLVFERDRGIVVAHAILLDMPAIATLEGPGLLWPLHFPISEAAAAAVEECVFPWLRSLVRGRNASAECIRSYRSSDAFERARERGFRGAVRISEALVSAAPFVYARRFAAGADVLIACDDAYHAAATIADIARSVDIDFSVVKRDDFACSWYGDPRLTPLERPDVAIVDKLSDRAARGAKYVVACSFEPDQATAIVPEPIACDHLFTFDPADAPEARRFSIRAEEHPDERPRRPAVVTTALGGSGGTIAMVLRDDAGHAPDADTDAAEEIARRLRGEGLRVESAAWNGHASIGDADLVHIFGGVGSPHVSAAMAAARARNVPFVLSLEPLVSTSSTYEENMVLAALRLGGDEESRRLYLSAYYGRKLRIDGIEPETAPEGSAHVDRAFETLAVGASTIMLEFADDLEAFARRFPSVARDRVVHRGSVVADEPLEGSVAALVPARPFVLAHVPFVVRSNLTALLAATNGADLGLVVAGPVSDVDLAITLRRIAGRDTVLFPDPSPALVAGLYRRAAAVVDMSIRPTGAARLLRGAMCGAMPLVSALSPLASIADPEDRFDPMDPASILGVLLRATSRTDGAHRAHGVAARLERHIDQRSSFHEVLAAYARAAMPDPVR